MFEKLNCLKVFIAAVFICHPLAVTFSIIEIKHGSYSVHTQPVYVELLDPVNGIGDQEILHFIFSIIENLSTPVGMLTFSGICILIKAGAVKFSKSLCVPRKMCRYPVKNDTDLMAMKIIYKISKIFRCPIT